MPTDAYRERYGILCYLYGRSITNPMFISDQNFQILPIPEDIVKLCTVNLTSCFYGTVNMNYSLEDFYSITSYGTKKEILDYYHSVENFNKKINGIIEQNLPRELESFQKEDCFNKLLQELFPEGTDEKMYQKIIKKCRDEKGFVGNCSLIFLAEKEREVRELKSKLQLLIDRVRKQS